VLLPHVYYTILLGFLSRSHRKGPCLAPHAVHQVIVSQPVSAPLVPELRAGTAERGQEKRPEGLWPSPGWLGGPRDESLAHILISPHAAPSVLPPSTPPALRALATTSARTRQCHHCKARCTDLLPLLLCGGCKAVRYCSR
jgi:hypothetical protein